MKAHEDVRLRLYEAQRLRQHEFRENELEAQEADRLKQHELALVLEELKVEEARKCRNAERVRRKAEANFERERHEAEERQRECEYELHLQVQEKQYARDMERIEAQRSARPVPAPRDKIRARTPKIPAFFKVRMRWTHTC